MLSRVLPDVDVRRCDVRGAAQRRAGATRSRGRATPRAPTTRCSSRRGRFRRETDIVPHERVQSARLTPGSAAAPARPGTVHLDTRPGPVQPTAHHRDAQDARNLLDAEVGSPGGAGRRAARTLDAPTRAACALYGGAVTLALDLTDPAFVADPTRRSRTAPRDAGALARADRPTPRLQLRPVQRRPARPAFRPAVDRQGAGRAVRAVQLPAPQPDDGERAARPHPAALAGGQGVRARPRGAPAARASSSWPTSCSTRSAGRGVRPLEDFAEPLPVAVIAELLGVPEADRHLLRPWSQAIVKMYEYGRNAGRRDRRHRLVEGVLRLHARPRRRRRAEPGDDLVSHWCSPRNAGRC